MYSVISIVCSLCKSNTASETYLGAQREEGTRGCRGVGGGEGKREAKRPRRQNQLEHCNPIQYSMHLESVKH